MLARSKRGEHLAVFCLDLDRFKEVNDAHGHPVGDLLLKAVADRLRQCVRDIDMVARLGGDEFAIVQAGASQPTDATSLASRLIEVIGAPYELGGHQVTVELSIGIALAPGDGLDPDQLLKNADMALYRAKSDGHGLYRFFEPEMDARMQARRRLEIDLRKAIANGEFELFYQPLVDMQTENVTGFEALIRWHHPERGMIPPLDFIPVAEETGLIVPIGDWVLRQACAEAATWPTNVKVAVNLSPIQFKNKALLLVRHIRTCGIRTIAKPLGTWRLPNPFCCRTAMPRWPSCTNYEASEWGYRWMILALGIPRSVTCASFPSTRSKSIDRSLSTCRIITTASPSYGP